MQVHQDGSCCSHKKEWLLFLRSPGALPRTRRRRQKGGMSTDREGYSGGRSRELLPRSPALGRRRQSQRSVMSALPAAVLGTPNSEAQARRIPRPKVDPQLLGIEV